MYGYDSEGAEEIEKDIDIFEYANFRLFCDRSEDLHTCLPDGLAGVPLDIFPCTPPVNLEC